MVDAHRALIPALGLLLWGLPVAGAQTLYVQSRDVAVRAQPNYAAPVIATLERGTALEASRLADSASTWQEISHAGARAWVPRSMVAASPPMARFSVTEWLAQIGRTLSTHVDSRRRISDSSLVVTGVRGLEAEERERLSLRHDRADFKALEKLEAIRLDEVEVIQFLDARGAP